MRHAARSDAWAQSVTLPWPGRLLSPNNRAHWSARAAAKKAIRQACAWQCVIQGLKAAPPGRYMVHMQFVPPDKRRRDLDNLIASMKAALDGLADAMRVDDSCFDLSAELVRDGTIGGFVRVSVTLCDVSRNP